MPSVGSTIADKYVLLEQIGSGSMGTVYRARHTALDRDVALKLMAPEVAHDRSFAARFRREAHAASRLTHPNSVMITDFGEEPDGLLYLVMEHVPGVSLEAMLERGEILSERRTVDILSQVLSAVAVAHAAGIVHRDLKPANVIVVESIDDDGKPIDLVKVCDFGVASLRDRADLITNTSRHAALRPDASRGKQLTLAGCVVGTPAYMAPEQASGGVQDERTDLYSLGIVLFELLTGKLPLWGETLEDTMRRQIDTPAPSPCEYVECTPALAEVCLRALAKRPADRFESARAMRSALRAALDKDDELVPHSAPLAASESLAGVAAVAESEPQAKRRPGLAWPWVAAALAAGAVASTTWLSHGRPYEAEARQLVNRVETLVPGAAQQPMDLLTLSVPERLPLVVSNPHVDVAPPSLVVEELPGPEPQPRARVLASRHAKRLELAVAPEPTQELEPAVDVAERAPAAPPPLAEDTERKEDERAFATRH